MWNSWTGRSNSIVASVVCAVMGLGGVARGQAVLPSDRASLEGSSGNSIPSGGSVGRFLALYDPSQLGGIPVGSYIRSMRLRLKNSANVPWPVASSIVTQYDVTLATSTRTASTISLTYADNMQNPVLVRGGSLNVAAQSYPGAIGTTGSIPEGWGPEIVFTTPYKYTGGPLVIDIRTNGDLNEAAFMDIHGTTGVGGLGNISAGPNPTTGFSTGAGLVVQLGLGTPDSAFQSGVTKVYLPEQFATVDGGAQNFAMFPSGARTVQSSVAAGEIDTIGVGSSVVGLAMRNSEAAAWPPANTTFSQWELRMSRSLTLPSALSATIATNQPANATLVRGGALQVLGGSMAGNPAGPLPAAFTFQIPFAQSFRYMGGPLLTVLRTQGTVSGSVDSILPSNAAYGPVVASKFEFSASATATPSTLNHAVVRLSVDAGTVVPNSALTGTSDGINTALRDAQRTLQVIVAASELSYIPRGSLVTGLTLRQYMPASSAWPASSVSFASYKIEVSSSQRKAQQQSTTFAENEGADKIVARDGPLLIEAGAFGSGGTPANEFGTTIQFQRGFVYRGGDLCITIRHSGFGSGSNTFMETRSDTTRMNAAYALVSNATAATGFLAGPVMLLSYTPSVALPRAYENVDGPNGYSIFTGPGVAQTVFGVGEMRHIPVGSLISGLSVRKSSFGSTVDWPTSDLAVGRFDVTLSTSPNAPGAMSNTFASNIGADAVAVRSGAIVIPARALPASVAPTAGEHEWFVEFQRPFRYTGGPLSVTIRHTVPASAGAPTIDVDDLQGSDARSRYNLFSDSADAVASDEALQGPLVMRLAFVPRSFCVADLNGDGFVDDVDFVEFTQAYDVFDCGASLGIVQPCPADFTFDGFVDDSDFVIFAAAYAEFTCPE